MLESKRVWVLGIIPVTIQCPKCNQDISIGEVDLNKKGRIRKELECTCGYEITMDIRTK